MRCWLCGVGPLAVTAVASFTGEIVREIPTWPSGDHAHAVRPPSPAELVQAGHEALLRIVDLTDPRSASERLRLPTETVRW